MNSVGKDFMMQNDERPNDQMNILLLTERMDIMLQND